MASSTELGSDNEGGSRAADGDPNSVEQLRRASASDIHDTIRAEGDEELKRPTSSLFWSGLAAGLAMGFSLVLEGLLEAGLPETSWRPLITSFGYTAGFLIVVLGRQQLFTENTLTVVLPVLEEKSLSVFALMLRLWGIVFVMNIVGTLLFASAAAYTEIFSPEARQAFADIGQRASEGGVWVTFLRAIVAGWLIALMVWLLPQASAARVLVIIIMTYIVGLAGLAHVIAGSTEVAYAAFVGRIGWSEYWVGFLLPALLGNIAGGVTLVAVLNHGQVHNE